MYASYISNDGRCIRIGATTPTYNDIQNWSPELRFKSLIISIQFPSTMPSFRTRVFEPQTPSVVGITALGEYVETSVDPGVVLHTRDEDPPRWINCPSTISVQLARRTDRATLTWSEPTAVDNIGIRDFSRSHRSGDTFFLWNSPYEVVYQATDMSGNSAECRFNVSLTYNHWTESSMNQTITAEAIGHAVQTTPGIPIAVVESSIFETANRTTGDFSVNIAGMNRLVWRYSAPPGRQFRLFPTGKPTYLELSMLWAVSQNTSKGAPIIPFAVKDSYVTVRFHNLRSFDGNTTTDIPDDSISRWFQSSPVSSLTSTDGLLVAGKGSTHHFMSDCLFQGLTVSFSFPQEVTERQTGNLQFKLQHVKLHFAHFFVDVFGAVAPTLTEPFLRLVSLDIIPPTITCPAGFTVTADDVGSAVVSADLVAPVELRDAEGDVFLVQDAPLVYSLGRTDVTLIAEDEEGNRAQCTFTVHVISSTEETTTSSASSSLITTASGAIGGGLGGLLLMLLLVMVLRYRRAALHAKNSPYDFSERIAELALSLQGPDGFQKPREIRRNAVKLLEVLGTGNWGEVHKGLLEEYTAVNIPGFLVAVKTLKNSASESVDELLREAAFMAQFNDEHVLRLHGVITMGQPHMIVMEFCEHGSLSSYLKKTPLDLERKNALAGDCAEGMAYLASRGVVHRDLAARNVLVTSDHKAKIADFGLTRDTDGNSEYYNSRGGAIPVRWSAPEALEDHKFSEMSDVWSYGVLVWEIWSKAELPYKGMSNQKVWVEVLAGARLDQPADCPEEIFKVMLKCWDATPRSRPVFRELAVFFRDGATDFEASQLHASMIQAEAQAQAAKDAASSPSGSPKRPKKTESKSSAGSESKFSNENKYNTSAGAPRYHMASGSSGTLNGRAGSSNTTPSPKPTVREKAVNYKSNNKSSKDTVRDKIPEQKDTVRRPMMWRKWNSSRRGTDTSAASSQANESMDAIDEAPETQGNVYQMAVPHQASSTSLGNNYGTRMTLEGATGGRPYDIGDANDLAEEGEEGEGAADPRKISLYSEAAYVGLIGRDGNVVRASADFAAPPISPSGIRRGLPKLPDEETGEDTLEVEEVGEEEERERESIGGTYEQYARGVPSLSGVSTGGAKQKNTAALSSLPVIIEDKSQDRYSLSDYINTDVIPWSVDPLAAVANSDVVRANPIFIDRNSSVSLFANVKPLESDAAAFSLPTLRED